MTSRLCVKYFEYFYTKNTKVVGVRRQNFPPDFYKLFVKNIDYKVFTLSEISFRNSVLG